MTTKIWNGSDGNWNLATDWSSGQVPAAGDTAVINDGTVTVTTALPSPLTVDLDASATTNPTLVLGDGGSLALGSFLRADDASNFTTLAASGTATNAGGITFTGSGGGSAFVTIQDAANAGATQLINTGGISVVDQAAAFENVGTNTGSSIVNDGVISLRNSQAASYADRFNVSLSGTGTVRIGAGNQLQLGRPVSSGQTIVLEPGTGGQILLLTAPGTFDGTISGFGAPDQVQMTSPQWDASSYSLSNGVGTWTFTASGTPVATIRFAGDYAQSDFGISTSVSGTSEQTTITTTVPEQPARFAFSDTANAVSGVDAGTAYTGPVAGLDYQYLWGSSDDVALSAQVPNVFLKGGAGDDALAVTSGTNVLDGGGGSNFLVGGTGNDTFFVDGRGNAVTWSTIVNFHEGDQATIFGFHAGQSTLPFTASDGVAGYTGVTIHSELNGAGTGVNASMTFAGIDQATLDAHFTFTTGTLQAGTADPIDYLLIQYNH